MQIRTGARPVWLALVAAIVLGTGCGYDEELVDVETWRAALTQGQKLYLQGTSGILQYTRVWTIGSPSNITRIYFANHGDHQSDYSTKTAADRTAMAAHIPAGEGALIAYPVSVAKYWPAFQGGKNGAVLLQMFRELEQMTGKQNVLFEQFSLSGGGRLNLALMRLVNDNYDTDSDVRSFVDNNLRGVHDGDSLAYDKAAMKQNYKSLLQRFNWVKGAFIHNTSGKMAYVHGEHDEIARYFNSNQGYPYGGSLSILGGRLRFWSAPTHFDAWRGQFAKVFFGGGGTTTPGPVPPSSSGSFIGDPCAVDSACSGGKCFTTLPSGYAFFGGMCSETCTRYCPDLAGRPTTFCVAFDPNSGALGRRSGLLLLPLRHDDPPPDRLPVRLPLQ